MPRKEFKRNGSYKILLKELQENGEVKANNNFAVHARKKGVQCYLDTKNKIVYLGKTRRNAPLKITKPIWDAFEAGAQLSTNDIVDMLGWDKNSFKARFEARVTMARFKKRFKKAGKILGHINGKYQLIDESTLSREANRVYNYSMPVFNNFYELLTDAIIEHGDKSELTADLEMFLLGAQELYLQHRRKILNHQNNASLKAPEGIASRPESTEANA